MTGDGQLTRHNNFPEAPDHRNTALRNLCAFELRTWTHLPLKFDVPFPSEVLYLAAQGDM